MCVLFMSEFGAFFLAVTASEAAASEAAIQSLQNLQLRTVFCFEKAAAGSGSARPTSRVDDVQESSSALTRLVVSSDGLEKEGKGLSWLSLSLRPRQAPALLTFQPGLQGRRPLTSSS